MLKEYLRNMIKWNAISDRIKSFSCSKKIEQPTSCNTDVRTDRSAEFADYISNIILPECKKGNIEYFDIAQKVFTLPSEKQLHIDVAAVNEELLSDISVKRLIWLSENFRNLQYDCIYGYEADWGFVQNIDVSRQAFLYLTDGQYWSMLKLGTFMSNGYYRQRCMEQLKGVDGSLPFLILRMNDWVAHIRDAAFALVQLRIHECGLHELFMSLPMLEKVKNANRRASESIHSVELLAEEMIGQRLRLITDDVIDEIYNYEIQVRNAIYRFINRNRVLEREKMERLLAKEKSGYGKMLIISGIFRHYGYDRLRTEEYLLSKSAIVRYYALIYRYEQEHNAWQGLEQMLLDSSKRIRNYASYIIEKCTDIDVTEFYLKELPQKVSPVTLLGIGEHGRKTELNIIMPYLNDKRPIIVKKAYCCIKKYKIQYGALRLYETYVQKRFTSLAVYFLNLLLCEPSWERLPYLLMLYCDQEVPEKQRLMILAGINRRHMYAKVSRQQSEEICGILEQNRDKISEDISKGILFDLKYVMK